MDIDKWKSTQRSFRKKNKVLVKRSLILMYFFQYTLNLELLTKEVFTKWMEVLRIVLSQPVPEHTLVVDEDERLELPWWKVKKWAIHTLYRLFER